MMVTQPEFSLTYGGKPFYSQEQPYQMNTDGNRVYSLAEGITVTVCKMEYPAFDAMEWVLYFENKTSENSLILENICDSDIKIPLNLPPLKRAGYRFTEGDLCVTAVKGCVGGNYYLTDDPKSAEEFSETDCYLREGWERSFSCRGGRSSDEWMPFFRAHASNAGVTVAIGWTGGWRAHFTGCADGIEMQTGLATGTFYLKAGERIRTTATLIMNYTAEEDEVNKFRRLIKTHYAHQSYRKRDGLLAVEFWGGLPSAEMKKRLQELGERDICFEDVWIDAGWYGNCTKCDEPFSGDWARHTGEWTMNPRVHPCGMEDVSLAANAVGMKLMLWIEPERVAPDMPITKEHPEWLIPLKNENGEPNGGFLVNYGCEEALRSTYEMIAGYVEKLNLSCYRQDFNTPLDASCRFFDEEGRTGITELYHILGMYRLWDMLHERFPDLVIDDCSSGGRRIDIETLRRAVPFFRSDYQCNFNECSEVLQTHHAGISAYLPYTGCTTKTKADTYAARSSYSSSWGGAFYNAVFHSMSEEDFTWAKERVDEYRRIRPYFNCDIYELGAKVFDDSSWCIRQYHDTETDSGMIMAFRRPKSPFDRVTIPLHGVCREQDYCVENMDTGKVEILSGETCRTDGITLCLPNKRESLILLYRKK